MSLRPRTPATAPPCGGVYPSCCASSGGRGGRLATVLATGLGRLKLAPSMPSMPSMPTDTVYYTEEGFNKDFDKDFDNDAKEDFDKDVEKKKAFDVDECAICHERMLIGSFTKRPFVLLACGHAFHVDCMSKWITINDANPCPSCRTVINEQDRKDVNEVEADRVRPEFPNGKKDFFEGEQGAERKVRTEFQNGNKEFFEGERGAERLVRTESPDGEQGAERQVRMGGAPPSSSTESDDD